MCKKYIIYRAFKIIKMEFSTNFIMYLIEYLCIENYSIIIPGFIHDMNLIRYELQLIKNEDF